MVKTLYYSKDVIDCTADPHVVHYPTLQKACEDVVKVCESSLVFGIELVRLEVKKGEEDQESDHYQIEKYDYDANKPFDPKLALNDENAKKHKVAGLFWNRDATITIKRPDLNPKDVPEDYARRGKAGYRYTLDGMVYENIAMPKERHLPPGLTGVKVAVQRLLANPRKWSRLHVRPVWSAFMDTNCSDEINLEVDCGVTVDYSNQDWYRDNDTVEGQKSYKQHLQGLSEILGVHVE